MRDYDEVYAPSCHDVGKSFIASVAAHWFLTHPNAIVVTTAPTGRQVRQVLWREMRRRYNEATVPLGGEMLQTEYKIDDKWYAFGFSTDEPTNFSGIHSEHVLLIVDEATGITPDIWEGTTGILSNEHSRLLAIGNPTDAASEFAARCRRGGERVKVIPINAYESPNFTELGITEADIASGAWKAKCPERVPYPYLVTPKWVADIYHRYGPDSAMYVSRVLGRFPESSADTLIPLAWVLNAVERWKDITDQLKQGRDIPLGPDKQLGVDVARFGADRTVRTYRQGAYVHWQRVTQQESLMQTAGRVANDLTEQKMPCNVDVIGLGAGVADRLKELHYDVYGINVADRASDPERFANLRAEGYWRLRERFERGQIMIPDDDELINELTSLKYKIVNSNGQIRMEEKEEMKKRLGKSPDLADSLCLAFLAPPQGPDVMIEFI